MTIVPIGNLTLQVPESNSTEFMERLSNQMKGMVLGMVGRVLEESLETEVDRLLERERYVRRRRAKRRETGVYCSRCRSHQRQDFHRNGHYLRQLVVEWGRVKVNMPQVKCRCGGNVRMKYRTIRSRQRIWEDVDLKIQAEYGRGLSYRQIKDDYDRRLHSSVGLRTLNQRVLSLGCGTGSYRYWKGNEAPPVVRLDGIWITVMFATGETQKDQAGRTRPVKQGHRIPVLAAQGVWPTTGRTELLAWMRADGEDAASWQSFLEALYEAGISAQNGLSLLVADGGTGFRAAYENVYWQIPLQRCVFHKLRNIARAIHTPAELDHQAGHLFRTEFISSAADIWQATNETEARQLFSTFCQTWQAKQVKAIQTLTRDFDDTLTFFAVQEQAALRGELWPAHLLRTTSQLERMFREFRQRYRRAILFHSPIGLQAATALLAARFS